MDSRAVAAAPCAVMALSLVLLSGEIDPPPRLPCDAPRLVIGRARSCEVQLPDPSVSRRHASLRQRGSGYVLIDEGSENGTYVGRRRLESYAPHRLAAGELFRVGRVWLQVLGEAAPASALHGRELARALVRRAATKAGEPAELVVAQVAEPEPEGLPLAEPRRAYRVGRAEDCDLPIDDDGVAAHAVQVERRGDQVRVTVIEDVAGVSLGSAALPVGRRTSWPVGTPLHIGACSLRYRDPLADWLQAIERGATERLPPDEPVAWPEGYQPEPLAAAEPAGTGPGERRPTGRGRANAQAAPAPPRPERPRRPWAKNPGSERWTWLDSLVLCFALGVLGVSLWAIRWVVDFNPV